MYNYQQAVMYDIKDFIKNTYDTAQLMNLDVSNIVDQIRDELWDSDAVTGNIYGYDSEDVVLQYVGENLKLALEALREFGCNLKDIPEDRPGRWLDTTIRCYLLDQYLEQAVKELKHELQEQWREDSL